MTAIVEASHRIAKAADVIAQAAAKMLETMAAAEERTVRKIAAEVRKTGEARQLLAELRGEVEQRQPPPGGRKVLARDGSVIQLGPDEDPS